jgi:hypothetical protein
VEGTVAFNVTEATDASVTKIVAEATFPSIDATIVACPFVTPVTTPLVTVATDVLDDAHVTVLPVITESRWSLTVGVIVIVRPTSICVAVTLMDTVVTTGVTGVGATTALSHAARLNIITAANKTLFMLYSFKMKTQSHIL